ncbi:MAG: uroporphyrinogen decarboxylase family protein [Spirochaetia bacterium]
MSLRPPIPHPAPDFRRLEKVLRRSGVPDRVPFYEIFSNIEADVLEALGDPAMPGPARRATDRNEALRALRTHVRHQFWMGYDFAAVRESMTGFLFPQKEKPTGQTTEGARPYITQELKTIEDRAGFERYPWPDMRSIDYSPFELAPRLLPEGMAVIGDSPGVFENVMWLLGYEGISYLLYDDPGLIKDMFEEVGQRVLQYFDTIASFDCVGALRYGDDLGFKTQLLLPPAAFTEYLLPWHRRIVSAAHDRGKPIILHSCGNLSAVIEQIIDTGWDARHSFEDVIEPVWEAKRKYGARIAHLGGFDMVKLPSMSVEEVRAHTRFLIERCAPGGGWALGSGNSIPEYVPVANLVAMLSEGYAAGRY